MSRPSRVHRARDAYRGAVAFASLVAPDDEAATLAADAVAAVFARWFPPRDPARAAAQVRLHVLSDVVSSGSAAHELPTQRPPTTREALLSLDPADRVALVAFTSDGLDATAVGRLLGVDAGEAKRRLEAAGEALATRIGATSLPDFSAVSDVIEVEIRTRR